MTYIEAKNLKQGDLVEYVGSPMRLKLVVTDVELEECDYFVRCNDGKLYHHTALKMTVKE